MIKEINKFVIQNVFSFKGVDSLKLNRYLYNYGMVYFTEFNGEKTFYPCSIVLFNGVTDKPQTIRIFSERGGFSKTITDCDPQAIMYAFDADTIPAEIVREYNEMLKDIVITERRQLDSLKLGWVLSGGDKKVGKNLKTFFTELRKDSEQCPVFHLAGSETALDLDNLKLFSADKQTVRFEDLQQFKNSLIGECYRIFGIDNLDINKKERLLTDEINANNNLFSLALVGQEKARQVTIDYLNTIGWNIKLVSNINKDSLESETETKEVEKEQPQEEEKENE